MDDSHMANLQQLRTEAAVWSDSRTGLAPKLVLDKMVSG
jgi:hypothetical protein